MRGTIFLIGMSFCFLIDKYFALGAFTITEEVSIGILGAVFITLDTWEIYRNK